MSLDVPNTTVRRRLFSAWRTRFTFAWPSGAFVVVLATGLAFAPIELRWLRQYNPHVSLEHLLLFIAGLSNAVAILDICRANEVRPPSKWYRAVLIGQLLLLAALLGFDAAQLVSGVFVIVAGLVLLVVTLFMIGFSIDDEHPKTTRLQSGLAFGFLAIGALIAEVSNRHLGDWANAKLLQYNLQAETLNAYVHLVLVPILYLTVDFINRRWLGAAAASLSLDVGLVLIGLSCVGAGLADPTPMFEAGASAVVLLLGNWVYVKYIDSRFHRRPATVPI